MHKLPHKIHVIGICGVAMSALAIAFHERGVKVTGSDKGFFPPVSTELEKHGIDFYAGWHPEKMIEGGTPDLVIVGTASGTHNTESLYARENGLPMFSYPEIIAKYFVKDNSIVCAGTWGKSSSSALLSYILERAGLDPSYMFGGVSLSHSASAKVGGGIWSVLEGDEYKSSPTDKSAKFLHYKPTHVLLTGVSWDHADLYPTEADYFAAFAKLVSMVPAHGLIVVCSDDEGVARVTAQKKVITYGRADADFIYSSVKQTPDGLDFTVSHGGSEWHIHSPMLGAYQAENITGCFAMAVSIGIDPGKIIEATADFRGLKRRLEVRSTEPIVIDDIAHSPEKAASVLATLRDIYRGKIVAVFEPNIGGRERDATTKYDNAFLSADVVIIPRLTKLKVASDPERRPMEGDELAEVIGKTHKHVIYIGDDDELVTSLKTKYKKDDVIVFLGSHGFRGMIEEVTSPHPRSQS